MLTDGPVRPGGEYVLYWMTAARRVRFNFAVDRALELGRAHGRPLLVLEALRVGYRWASDRLHAFVLDGMSDNRDSLAAAGVAYLPYVEPTPGAGAGLLEALAARAVAVVTDDFPCFFLPRMLEAAAARLDDAGVCLEAVDSNGLYPMYATDRVFSRAADFRRHLHRELLPHLRQAPTATPLERYDLGRATVPADVASRWPAAEPAMLARAPEALARLPIDHAVPAVPERGGARAGEARLARFLDERLARYGEGRNHPDDDAASGLSPYLHFGHVSIHDVFSRLVAREGWTEAKVQPAHRGKREGFWGASAAFESFVDEAVTWRELGYNLCSHRDDYDRYDSLPAWAKETLAEHARDPRPRRYGLRELEAAETYDEIWNAAQRELVATGRMHNYLRMLWGKKILEWSESPEVALEVMITLNDKYALDGRNPNSYSGICWVLGRYDRAWGPERPIYGKVRYMTSESTRRKLRMTRYLARWSRATLPLPLEGG